PATINNTGTFQKSGGTGNSAIGPAFNNNGTLNVQSGTMSLYSGGDSHGSFNAAGGATLNFASGTMTLEANSTVTAAGTGRFSGGGVDGDGSYTGSGGTAISGGTAKFEGEGTRGRG